MAGLVALLDLNPASSSNSAGHYDSDPSSVVFAEHRQGFSPQKIETLIVLEVSCFPEPRSAYLLRPRRAGVLLWWAHHSCRLLCSGFSFALFEKFSWAELPHLHTLVILISEVFHVLHRTSSLHPYPLQGSLSLVIKGVLPEETCG